MKIINEAARLFFAMTALILVGLLSAPMGGVLSTSPIATAKVTESKIKSEAGFKSKTKSRAEKLAQNQKKIKLRKS